MEVLSECNFSKSSGGKTKKLVLNQGVRCTVNVRCTMSVKALQKPSQWHHLSRLHCNDTLACSPEAFRSLGPRLFFLALLLRAALHHPNAWNRLMRPLICNFYCKVFLKSFRCILYSVNQYPAKQGVNQLFLQQFML